MMRLRATLGVIGATIGMCILSGEVSAQTLVTYDPNAPVSNFSTPGPSSNTVAYTISLSEDATNLSGTITSDPSAGGTYSLSFANLYFGVGSSATSGSTLGIQVTNGNAFDPDTGTLISLAGTGYTFSNTGLGNGVDVIKFTLPWSFLETDPLGIGFTTVSSTDPDVILRLSQSFGYSVAGGTTFGTDRLGLEALPGSTPVPLPSSLMLLVGGLMVFGFAAWRRQSPLPLRNFYAAA